jgi:hypothetical protein
MRGQIVFSVVLGRTVSAETWTRFLERVQAAGLTPFATFRRFIERVAAGEQEP